MTPSHDYLKQVTTEKRARFPLNSQPSTSNRSEPQVRKDNPLWDCERMVLMAAVMTRIVQASPQVG